MLTVFNGQVKFSFLNAKGDGLDLHADIPGQPCRLNCGPGRGFIGEEFFINIINRRVIIQVFHEDSRLNDIVYT